MLKQAWHGARLNRKVLFLDRPSEAAYPWAGFVVVAVFVDQEAGAGQVEFAGFQVHVLFIGLYVEDVGYEGFVRAQGQALADFAFEAQGGFFHYRGLDGFAGDRMQAAFLEFVEIPPRFDPAPIGGLGQFLGGQIDGEFPVFLDEAV